MTEHDLPIRDARLMELAAPLSQEARVILNRILASIPAGAALTERAAEELLEGFEDLSEEDQSRIIAINHKLEEGYHQRIQQDMGYRSLFKQLKALSKQALELEPALRERENVTVREIFSVLERHGVKHGISPEV